jgi:hypothetical protein
MMPTARDYFIDDGFSRLATLGCPNFGFSDKAPKSGDDSVEALFEVHFNEMLEHIRDFENGDNGLIQSSQQALISHLSILKAINIDKDYVTGLSKMRAVRESGVDDKSKARTPAQQKAWADHDRRVAGIDKYALDMTLAANELARKKLHDVNVLPGSYIPLEKFLHDTMGVSELKDEAKGAAELTKKYKYQLQEGDLNTAWWSLSARKAQAQYRGAIGKENTSLFDGGPYLWWLFGDELELKVGDYIDIEVTEHPAQKAGDSSRFEIKVHNGFLHLSKLGNPDTLNKMTYSFLTEAGVEGGLDTYSIHEELKDNVKDVLSFAKWMLKNPGLRTLVVTDYLKKLQEPNTEGLGKGVVTPKVLDMIAELKAVNRQLVARKERLEPSKAEQFERGVAPRLISRGNVDAFDARLRAVDLSSVERRVPEEERRGRALETGRFAQHQTQITTLRDEEGTWVELNGKVPDALTAEKLSELSQFKARAQALSKDLGTLIQDCSDSMRMAKAVGAAGNEFYDRALVVLTDAGRRKDGVDDVVTQLEQVPEPGASAPHTYRP